MKFVNAFLTQLYIYSCFLSEWMAQVGGDILTKQYGDPTESIKIAIFQSLAYAPVLFIFVIIRLLLLKRKIEVILDIK